MATILIVDDNEMVRDTLQRRLIRRGFAVLLAADGVQGILLAHQAQPDLIILDISMPGLDGFAVLRRLKRDAATRAIPTLVLTALAMGDERKRCLEAGADDYDTKPVNFAQ